MNKRTTLKFRQLAVVAIAWVIAGLMMSYYDYLVLRSVGQTIQGEYHFNGLAIAVNAGTGLVGALLGGSFLVFYVNEKFRDKPYWYTVFSIAFFFLFVVMVISSIKYFLLSGKNEYSYLSISEIVFNIDSGKLKNIITWFVVVCLTQLLLQMNSRMGGSYFGSLFHGRYNIPREERKVFMFLDLNSSTTIAESLGDERYHELLRDFFADIANPILESSGNIYQYVGDEVVVVWDYDDGIRQSRCVNCFFEIKRQVEANRGRYLKKYGLVPTFKAGFHSGKVIAGQVGTLRREITYSGDVLNTTSRMLGMCKEFGVEVITSRILLSELCLDKTFEVLQLGSLRLRGKEQEIVLNGIRPRE